MIKNKKAMLSTRGGRAFSLLVLLEHARGARVCSVVL